jgi:capsular polysaccharide transport system ATP-binding protein
VDAAPVIPQVEDFSELGVYLGEPVKKYSSGMRARLAFALSLAIDFDCFLIDEVVAVGDSRFHAKCNTELFEKRKDRAMIIVSHQHEQIVAHCDKAAVLHKGELACFDNVADAYEYYQAAA